MTTIYLDDRWTIKACGDELQHILEVDGVHYALSYLKQCVLVPPYSESPIFLKAISKMKAVKHLLSKIPQEEADVIQQMLKGGSDGKRGTGSGS